MGNGEAVGPTRTRIKAARWPGLGAAPLNGQSSDLTRSVAWSVVDVTILQVNATASKVVLWDFDGTLASRKDRWAGALIAALDATTPEHELNADSVRPGLRDGFFWHTPEVAHQHLDTQIRWWDHHIPLFEQAYRLAGVDPDSAASAASAVRSTFLDLRHWALFSDTRPTLSHLQAEGWQHIIVSNHVPELAELVTGLGLDDLIEQTLTSGITGYEKPHPEMFKAALNAAGHPGVVWMVGDNPVADIIGAESVGIPAILVRNEEDTSAVADLTAAARLIQEKTRGGRYA